MADQDEQYNKSWILHQVLERYVGSRELISVRRKLTTTAEDLHNIDITPWLNIGSSGEGFRMFGSDRDMMVVDKKVLVLRHHKDFNLIRNITNQTILVMRDANSRPGYTHLELVQLGREYEKELFESVVPVGNKSFLSSQLFTGSYNEGMSDVYRTRTETHGPATTMRGKDCNADTDFDIVISFPCYDWPQDADEWLTRPRLKNWPDKALRDQIVQDGCHLVPVGDKTSDDTFLQWRISFSSAERKLIHSLSHVQFLVYGLFKNFLKQISDWLQHLFGDIDILSSYIIKTVVLHAVENTSDSFWQEKYTFFCFMFCLSTLISWVKAGYCPNYFINKNNMFLGKVCGENQQKLLNFLVVLYDLKWGCLSVGEYMQPSIGELVQGVHDETTAMKIHPPAVLERKCDMEIFVKTLGYECRPEVLSISLARLSKSTEEIDEYMAYANTARALSYSGMTKFEEHLPVKGNKDKYKFLKTCKNLLLPCSLVCTSPGLLTLATYHYTTGNYKKTLEMCAHMISSFKMYVDFGSCFEKQDKYEYLFCGRGYTLLQKCKEVFVTCITFLQDHGQFCPSQIRLDVGKYCPNGSMMRIPPLPYAVFLSFLCYHELGDTRTRNTALIELQTVKYDQEQGGSTHYVVHNLLGICFEMVGDKRRALEEYRSSVNVRHISQYQNSARERMERLQTL
ncbi:uncharacterized protein LOC132544161 [Ylistrum balloti]|uniref:uncharacterized protein LOC132544161 n=1 Tax=Ylistrum balloti TaxID=509963 RepID=UPI002905F464|nr:uncharacterized protein LOC132544161 [Ylistrum balloti]